MLEEYRILGGYMDQKILITRLFGGIGNQMFIYASSFAIAKSINAKLIIDNHSGFISDHIYNRTYQLSKFNISSEIANASQRMEPFPRIRRKLSKFINSYLGHSNKTYIEESSRLFNSQMLALGDFKKIYIEGYWQTEKYFRSISNEIKDELTIQPPLDLENQKYGSKILNENSVCIHIRFFDEEKPFEIVEGYYQKAMTFLLSNYQNLSFYLFSDQPKRAKDYLNLPNSSINIIDHNKGDENAYADLWLMSQCKYFIVSNSSFSWWGAWLASYKNKAILRPYLKIESIDSNDDSGDFYPQDWIRIS